MSASESQLRLPAVRRWPLTGLRVDRFLMPLLGLLLLLRVLTDDRSSPYSRHSGSLNLSGVIAVALMIVAAGLLVARRRGVPAATLGGLWLCIWTAIAITTSGASSETLREGVREASVLALAMVVYNAPRVATAPRATRLIQAAGVLPALLALYQLPTHTGMLVSGHLRSHGTFAHSDSAVMFFSMAAAASLWRYLDHGRGRLDVTLTALFAAAALSTYALDGLITLLVMMVALGALYRGPLRMKAVPFAVAALIAVVFFATPFGAQRISKESSINVTATERGDPNTSLAWRFHKWETLVPLWEASPVLGRGLGTTTTTAPQPYDRFVGQPPHDEYVRYLVETGVLGFVILLAAFGAMIRAIFRRRRFTAHYGQEALSASTIALVAITGCLINSLADNTLLNSPTCYAAVLLVVPALALSRNLQRGTARAD